MCSYFDFRSKSKFTYSGKRSVSTSFSWSFYPSFTNVYVSFGSSLKTMVFQLLFLILRRKAGSCLFIENVLPWLAVLFLRFSCGWISNLIPLRRNYMLMGWVKKSNIHHRFRSWAFQCLLNDGWCVSLLAYISCWHIPCFFIWNDISRLLFSYFFLQVLDLGVL
jgi:hypothetical protein